MATPLNVAMSHERMRWGYMDDRKLLTRLGRMTKPQKLECFITLARENNNAVLLEAAYRRVNQLGYDYLVPPVMQVTEEMTGRPHGDIIPGPPANPNGRTKGVRVIRFKKGGG